MGVIIEESEMRFGEYPETNVFQIEKSKQYQLNLMSKGIKTCEFLLLRNNRNKEQLFFIEAKRSLPEDCHTKTEEKAIELHERFIQEITLKIQHSLQLFACILLKRYDQTAIPERMCKNDLHNRELRIVLVVKTAKEEKLQQYSDILAKRLRSELKIWNIQQVFVMNEEKARSKGFVI